MNPVTPASDALALSRRFPQAPEILERLMRDLLVARVHDGSPPFEGVKTKPDDLWSIALLHGWSEALDILYFYQERLLNEGYVRTASDRQSLKLLYGALGLTRIAAPMSMAPPKPGAPALLSLDPGCTAVADFVFTVRAGPGLPRVTVLPAGAQLRHHTTDAPTAIIFETSQGVALSPRWNALPLVTTPARPGAPVLAEGAPGFLIAAGPAPKVGERLLIQERDDAAVWLLRQARAVVARRSTGLYEVLLDTPVDRAFTAPQLSICARTANMFGWNAPDFSSLPAQARLAALQGLEDTLAGGVSLSGPGGTQKLNTGLPAAAPSAVAVGPDGTVYLAGPQGLLWRPPGQAWRTAPAGVATRGVSLLAVSDDGLLMVGGQNGGVWTSRDPAQGFDALAAGYVLEPASAKGSPAKPVKAALTGGPARALVASPAPAPRILAQTDGGVFEYDPRGYWLWATARDWRERHGAFTPIQARLNGARLVGALLSPDRALALLATGSQVEAVRLGPPAAPAAPVVGAQADSAQAEGAAKAASKGAAPAPPLPARCVWIRKRLSSLAIFRRRAPRKPSPRRSGVWSFDALVTALAPLQVSATGAGWDSFLVATTSGVFLADWNGEPRPAGQGLPAGATADRFVVARAGSSHVVRTVLAGDVYRFDPDKAAWAMEVAAQTAGPLLAAAQGERLAVAEPLQLPAEWPGFALPTEPKLDLATPTLDLPRGARVALTAPDGAAALATVDTAPLTTLDAFGMKGRAIQAALTIQAGYPSPSFERRTLTAHVAGPPIDILPAARAPERAVGPGRTLTLAGDWSDLGQVDAQTLPILMPISGVAGATRQPVSQDAVQVGAWGTQPLDLAGVTKLAATGTEAAGGVTRLAVTGRPTRILPRPLGGVWTLAGTAIPHGVRALQGIEVRALAAFQDGRLAATATAGVFRQAGADPAWEPASEGLAGGALDVTALVLEARGGVLAATANGVYRAGADLKWTQLAPSPPTAIAALCLDGQDQPLAGGPAGVFAWRQDRWIALYDQPVCALAVLAGGELVLGLAAGSVQIADAPGAALRAWSERLADVRAAAIRPVADGAYLACDGGLFRASLDGVVTHLFSAAPVSALEVDGRKILAAAPGEGVHVSRDGGVSWSRSPVGLANDLLAVALLPDGQVLAGASLTARLKGAQGQHTTWRFPPVAATLPAATPGLPRGLDAGLAAPLRTALPSDAAKLLPDEAEVTVIQPGALWRAGGPGVALGAGALLMALQGDALTVFQPAEAFDVTAAQAANPMVLTLESASTSGTVEAWPNDFILVPGGASTAVRTLFRDIAAIAPSQDRSHTALSLGAPLDVLLDPSGASCSANVASATQGETVAGEMLGVGDPTASFQAFTLRRAPLTFTPGPDGAGQSTLHVYVDGIEWFQRPSLVGAGPSDRVYLARITAEGRVEVSFGDGVTGARLPNGRVTATYRAGMIDVRDLSQGLTTLLAARPSIGAITGELITPARAPETEPVGAATLALPLKSLGRLVTLEDYRAFARNFLGVSQARADKLSPRGRPLVFLSLLLDSKAASSFSLAEARAAVAAAQAVPAPDVRLDTCVRLELRLAAQLWLAPSAKPEAVIAAARAALLARFGPQGVRIGEPRYRNEAEDCLQRLEGVAGVGVTRFHRGDRGPACQGSIDATPARLAADRTVRPGEALILYDTDEAIQIQAEPAEALA